MRASKRTESGIETVIPRRPCTLCGGETLGAWYWTSLAWSERTQLGLPASECATCGHLLPDPSSIFTMATDVPEGLVVRALAQHGAAGGTGVMVVDDDSGLRAVFARTLQVLGVCVHEAYDGRDALDRLDALAAIRSLPTLLFVDQEMPGMNGDELVAVVRTVFPRIVVIAMSGHTRSMPFAHGALPKPLRPADLVSVVRDFIPQLRST